MIKTIVAIDPGFDGGIVVVDSKGNILEKLVMPTLGKGNREYALSDIINFLRKYCRKDSTKVVIERQQAFPGQGVSSTFKTGYGFGMLVGIISAFTVQFEVVSAKDWQKEIFSSLSQRERDLPKPSRVYVERRFPKESFLANKVCTVPHVGLTDAACIAEYGRLNV